MLLGGGDGGLLHKEGVMVMRRPTVLALDAMLGPVKRETWVTCLELLQKIQLTLRCWAVLVVDTLSRGCWDTHVGFSRVQDSAHDSRSTKKATPFGWQSTATWCVSTYKLRTSLDLIPVASEAEEHFSEDIRRLMRQGHGSTVRLGQYTPAHAWLHPGTLSYPCKS